MATRLDRLMQYLRPERCLDPWFRRAEEGLASFVFPPHPIDTWIRLADAFLLFYGHILNFLLGVKDLRLDADVTWNQCRLIFQRLYGAGHVTAFEIITRNVEGGREAVARAFAHAMAEEQANRLIKIAISCYWDSLTVAEQIQAPDEFLADYKCLLTTEMREGSAVRLRANFNTFLQEVPRLYRRLDERVRLS